PTAIRPKVNRSAIDFHFRAPHCANAQKRPRRSIRQIKLPPECRVETGEPVRVRVNCSRKDYPLRPFITAQKIDGRITPGDPRKDRYRDTCKRSYPNRSMPWFENEHCGLTFSMIPALRPRAKAGRKHWIRQRNERKVSRLQHV